METIRTIAALWRSMPASERFGALAFPPLFLALFWVVWVMTPA